MFNVNGSTVGIVSVADGLQELSRRLKSLPEVEEPPATALQILGHHQHEQQWQRFLFYFLSPNKPHGLDGDLLAYLLSSLSDKSDLEFTFSRLDINRVQVKTEVITSNGRRADAVIWISDEWFLCWELKLWADEGRGQTNAYIAAESFNSIDLSKSNIPADGHHYLYLAPENSPTPKAEEFDQISWEWIAREIEAFLVDSHGVYPARTTAQLDDFTSTIQQELKMTEHEQNQREKANLYIDHLQEIEEVQHAFDAAWADFEESWGGRLARSMKDAKLVDSIDIPNGWVEIELQNKTKEPSRWLLHESSSWDGVTKKRWRRRTDDGSPIYSKPDDERYAHITFYHRLNDNRRQAMEDGVLELTLWHGNSSDEDFWLMVNEKIKQGIETKNYNLGSNISLTSRKGNILSAVYNISNSKHDDFFDAYLSTLERALIDFTTTQAELIDMIDRAFEESLEEFYGVS